MSYIVKGQLSEKQNREYKFIVFSLLNKKYFSWEGEINSH